MKRKRAVKDRMFATKGVLDKGFEKRVKEVQKEFKKWTVKGFNIKG